MHGNSNGPAHPRIGIFAPGGKLYQSRLEVSHQSLPDHPFAHDIGPVPDIGGDDMAAAAGKRAWQIAVQLPLQRTGDDDPATLCRVVSNQSQEGVHLLEGASADNKQITLSFVI